MNRIRVARFVVQAEAKSTQQRLKQNGIWAEVHDELGLALLWFVNKRRGGVRLEVAPEHATEAERLLRAWSDTAKLEGVVRCPECSSLRVDFPQFTPKSLLTNVAIGLVAELGLVKRQYYCRDCHFMWDPPGSPPRRVRPHMAPNYFLEPTETVSTKRS